MGLKRRIVNWLTDGRIVVLRSDVNSLHTPPAGSNVPANRNEVENTFDKLRDSHWKNAERITSLEKFEEGEYRNRISVAFGVEQNRITALETDLKTLLDGLNDWKATIDERVKHLLMQDEKAVKEGEDIIAKGVKDRIYSNLARGE